MINKYKNIDWIAAVVYPLIVILMETMWIYPWMKWIGTWPIIPGSQPVLTKQSVIIMLTAGLIVTRIFLRKNLPNWLIKIIITGCGLLMILLTLRYEYGAGNNITGIQWFVYCAETIWNTSNSSPILVIALLSLSFLWWRGTSLGQNTLYFKNIYRIFLLGLTAFIILIILWAMNSPNGSHKTSIPGIGFYVIAYFSSGVTAIVICHLYQLRRLMPAGEFSLRSLKRLLPVTLGLIALMIIISAIAGVFSEDVLINIGHAAKWLWYGLSEFLIYLLVPFAFIFGIIFYFLKWFLSLFQSDLSPLPEKPIKMDDLKLPEIIPAQLPLIVHDIIKWIIIAVLVGLILYIMVKTISRFRRLQEEDIEEIHESLFNWKDFREDLRLFLNMIGKRFQRKGIPVSSPGFQPSDDAAHLGIREIFRNLQWEAFQSGIARKPHETAFEYAARLSEMIPDIGTPLELLSEIYSKARYGKITLPENQVDDANNIWRSIRNTMRMLRQS